MTESAPHTPEITLGFTRGVSPSKWVRRWRAISPERPLAIVPFPRPFGRPDDADEYDMVLERSAPGRVPVGSEASGARTHHALRLYDEAVAVVLPKGHELAALETVSIAELEGVTLLDHPDHAPEWPAAAPWQDPAWMPPGPAGALELVAAGLGGILLPAPLARHIVDKHAHAIVRIADPLPGSSVWASWRVERDGPDLQHLAGVMRGRTARSSRGDARPHEAPAAPERAKRAPTAQKKQPKLNPNSRGAQLRAAKEKAERAKAERRRAKRR